jgi:hypothetical protein
LECSGACGDLGTFIPHVIGAITVAGLAPVGVLFGFAAFLIGTGLFYGLPLPVQPMKAISAVILTGGLRPGEVAAAGMMIGCRPARAECHRLDRPPRARYPAISERRASARAGAADGRARAEADP